MMGVMNLSLSPILKLHLVPALNNQMETKAGYHGAAQMSAYII